MSDFPCIYNLNLIVIASTVDHQSVDLMVYTEHALNTVIDSLS